MTLLDQSGNSLLDQLGAALLDQLGAALADLAGTTGLAFVVAGAVDVDEADVEPEPPPDPVPPTVSTGVLFVTYGPPTWTATLMAVTYQPDAQPQYVDVEDLAYSSMSVVDELAGSGLCEVACSVDKLSDTAKLRLRDGWRAPCEVWAWRNGVRVFAGPLVAARIENRGLALTARGLTYYLGWMASDVNYVARDRDQALIVRDLVDAYQLQEYGHFGLDTTGLTESGVLSDLTLLALSATTYDRVFSEMAARSEGFDLWADPATRALLASSPYRGNDLSGSVIIDGRQLVGTSWSASYAVGQVASDVIATASAPTGGGILARAANTILRALTGRRTAVASFADVTRRATLDAHAAQLVTDLGTQVVSVASRLVPVDFPYGQVSAGDLVTLDCDFGLGPISATRRLSRVTASVTSVGERLAVDFV